MCDIDISGLDIVSWIDIDIMTAKNIDFSQLNKVYDAAQKAGVSFDLVYVEPDNSWYFVINSAASSDRWIGKNNSFEIACECVLEWLNQLIL